MILIWEFAGIIIGSVSYNGGLKLCGAADSSWLSREELDEIFEEIPKAILKMGTLASTKGQTETRNPTPDPQQILRPTINNPKAEMRRNSSSSHSDFDSESSNNNNNNNNDSSCLSQNERNISEDTKNKRKKLQRRLPKKAIQDQSYSEINYLS